MKEELKPCPFCKKTPNVGLCGDRVLHYCDVLRETLGCTVEAWNTRAERTCHIVETDDGRFACSECGASYLGMFDMCWCPDCGAKVVGE